MAEKEAFVLLQHKWQKKKHLRCFSANGKKRAIIRRHDFCP
jgi:hypothetical protein